jgi:hypothetical protein
MVDGSEKYRSFYAKLICAAAKLDDPRIEEAFRSVKREPFAGPGRGGSAPTHTCRRPTTIPHFCTKTCFSH